MTELVFNRKHVKNSNKITKQHKEKVYQITQSMLINF